MSCEHCRMSLCLGDCREARDTELIKRRRDDESVANPVKISIEAMAERDVLKANVAALEAQLAEERSKTSALATDIGRAWDALKDVDHTGREEPLADAIQVLRDSWGHERVALIARADRAEKDLAAVNTFFMTGGESYTVDEIVKFLHGEGPDPQHKACEAKLADLEAQLAETKSAAAVWEASNKANANQVACERVRAERSEKERDEYRTGKRYVGGQAGYTPTDAYRDHIRSLAEALHGTADIPGVERVGVFSWHGDIKDLQAKLADRDATIEVLRKRVADWREYYGLATAERDATITKMRSTLDDIGRVRDNGQCVACGHYDCDSTPDPGCAGQEARRFVRALADPAPTGVIVNWDLIAEVAARGADPAPKEEEKCPYVCDPDCTSPRCPVKVWHEQRASRQPGDATVTPINPGVRKLVALLNGIGFITTDSGDGETHDFACDRDHAYVCIVSTPEKLIEHARSVATFMKTCGVTAYSIGLDESKPCIQATFDPIDNSAFIDLRGVDDSMLSGDAKGEAPK